LQGKGYRKQKEKKRAKGKEVWCALASKFWRNARNKALGREVARMMCTIGSNLLGCCHGFFKIRMHLSFN